LTILRPLCDYREEAFCGTELRLPRPRSSYAGLFPLSKAAQSGRRIEGVTMRSSPKGRAIRMAYIAVAIASGLLAVSAFAAGGVTKPRSMTFHNSRGYTYRVSVTAPISLKGFVSFTLGDPGRVFLHLPEEATSNHWTYGTSLTVQNLTPSRPAPLLSAETQLDVAYWYPVPSKLRVHRDRALNTPGPTGKWFGVVVPFGNSGSSDASIPIRAKTSVNPYPRAYGGSGTGIEIPESDKAGWAKVFAQQPSYITIINGAGGLALGDGSDQYTCVAYWSATYHGVVALFGADGKSVSLLNGHGAGCNKIDDLYVAGTMKWVP
jgi:hypothetical protein